MSKKSKAEMVPITAADMERFHRNAPASIKRREGTYTFDEFGAGLRSVFLGGVPIVGLLWFDWSAAQLMLFLLAGTWAAILCDFTKFWWLEKEIRAWAAPSYDDWHVWTIVSALRAGRETAPPSHLGAKYEPRAGVLIDFAVGGISTILICVSLIRSPTGVEWTELIDHSVMLWLAGLIVFQTLFTVWEIVEHRKGNPVSRQVKVALGIRGLGLFRLIFVLAAVTDGFEEIGTGVTKAMLAINGMIVLWCLGTMFGPFFIRKETEWLREYLRNRGAQE